MINQHLLDRESFARESTVDTMKGNMFLKHGDTVLVALGEGGYSFYNIVTDPNVVKLNNGLFAVLERDNKRYDKDEIDRIIEKLNKKIEKTEENDLAHTQFTQLIQNLSEKLLEKAEKAHFHTKDDIKDFPKNLPNPFSLTIVNGVNRVTYDGSETKEIIVEAGGGVPDAHTHNATDIITDRERQFVSVKEKDSWNSKADISHNHDERYSTIEETKKLLDSKSDTSHTHPATNIRVDNERTFVSNEEREKWNNKSDKEHKHKALVIRNGSKSFTYDGTQGQEIFIDTSNVAPIAHKHKGTDIEQDANHRFITDADKNIWNNKSDKNHSHNTLTIKTKDGSIVYDGTVNKVINISNNEPIIHEHKATEIIIDADHNFVTSAEKYTWNSKADGSHKHNASTIVTDDLHQFVGSSDKDRWNRKADAHGHPYLSLGGGTVNGSVTVNGDLRANRVYNSVWNDYAEFFERGEETEAGDIIALDCASDKEQYVKASIENPVVVGVHSDSFAMLIGGEETESPVEYYSKNEKKFIPVGLAGRVKVKVVGKVLKGQYIGLGNLPGIGSMVDYLSPYKVGIALEDKLNEEIGLVKILIK